MPLVRSLGSRALRVGGFFAALTAIALERVHYVEVAQQALIQMESERLRNSLLSALSHDLRRAGRRPLDRQLPHE